ncbi:hypothetical protein EYF80_058929 [Liparis tanakae]|uniref:Uncharacterized protein n=1 Tax=Liparis tanakae TaxID=230148 RepID=A0A4Z2EQ44_9TELE|nr:hypothetical protein EYF80_058929 [Liparis tanakae]
MLPGVGEMVPGVGVMLPGVGEMVPGVGVMLPGVGEMPVRTHGDEERVWRSRRPGRSVSLQACSPLVRCLASCGSYPHARAPGHTRTRPRARTSPEHVTEAVRTADGHWGPDHDIYGKP